MISPQQQEINMEILKLIIEDCDRRTKLKIKYAVFDENGLIRFSDRLIDKKSVRNKTYELFWTKSGPGKEYEYDFSETSKNRTNKGPVFYNRTQIFTCDNKFQMAKQLKSDTHIRMHEDDGVFKARIKGKYLKTFEERQEGFIFLGTEQFLFFLDDFVNKYVPIFGTKEAKQLLDIKIAMKIQGKDDEPMMLK